MKDTKSLDELENDDFETTSLDENAQTGGISAFVQKNGKMIIIFSLAIIVLVGLILLFRSNSQINETNAALALSRIEPYYLSGDYMNALNGNDSLPLVRGVEVMGLLAIEKEYSSTAAGQRAALFIADAYYMLGKYPDAKNYYDKATKSGIATIKVGGLAGIAACNEKDGKIKEAATEYLKAADLIPDDGLKTRYLYFAGLCNEKAGNLEEAKNIYRNIINLNSAGEFTNLSKAGIVRLGEDVE